MANTVESRTVKNIVTCLLTLSFALYSISSTLPTAYGMMQVLQTKEGETKSKLYSIYGYIIEGTFVKEEDQFIYFRDPSYQYNPVRKFKKNEIYKLVLPDGTIYLENNSLKATYEYNLSLREKGRILISSNNTNVPAWKNELLIVHFRDGTSAKLNNFIFMSGNDLVTEDTLLYKRGSYIYKTPVNKISSFEVKRFNRGRSLAYTIPLVLVISVIFGGLIHKQVHCHHNGDTECE